MSFPFIRKLLRRLFGKTYSGITSTFNKTLQDLEKLKAQNQTDIANNLAAVKALTTHTGLLQAEHDAAHKLHQNITAFLS